MEDMFHHMCYNFHKFQDSMANTIWIKLHIILKDTASSLRIDFGKDELIRKRSKQKAHPHQKNKTKQNKKTMY